MKYLLIIAMLSVGCKSHLPTPSPVRQKELATSSYQPDWVRQKPSSPGYYIGIGNAPLAYPDYQSNAKLEALDDLASEISVTIESSSLLNQVENSAGFREQFRSAIKSTTQQSITLHEQVESWSDDRYYWVQYRLNKSSFEQLRAEKKQKALDIASEFFIKGLEAERSRELIQSLHFFAQSIEALTDYINERNEVTIKGTSQLLAVESYSRILQIISDIRLSSDSSSYTFTAGESSKKVTFKAMMDITPVKNLVVILASENQKALNTDEKGNIDLQIHRKPPSQKLVATPNFDFLNAYPLTWALIHNFQPNQLTIRFNIPPITIQVISDEKNLNQEMNQQILGDFLKKLLTEQGYRVVDRSGEYLFEIYATTRKGSELSGLYTSYLDLNLKIKNQNEEVLFSDFFSNIKGIHTSYALAGLKAYQNVENELSEDIKRSVEKNFINKE
ncbi:MAG: LPP20 family lipoprotein [Bacteroidota bacterium]